MNCSECKQPIDDRFHNYWTKVEGWERRRSAGGTNHLAMRKQKDEFLCDACMRMLQRGLDPRQSSLI